nr:hypothetical protein [Sunxiuqinia sp.]
MRNSEVEFFSTRKYSYLKSVFIAVVCFVWASAVFAQPEGLTRYGQVAWEESTVPVRPGEPGKTAFWNGSARRFIYAPAFVFQKKEGARFYVY